MSKIREAGLNYNTEIDSYIEELKQLKINVNEIPDVRTLQEMKVRFSLLTSVSRRKTIECKYDDFYDEVTLDLERQVDKLRRSKE